MAAEQPIPIYTNLNDVYANLGTTLNHAVRWNSLAKEFEKRFGRKPAYIARAPGRVNLIGEHVDYSLFGVLPAAIERDILIACAPRVPYSHDAETYPVPGGVTAENVQSKYPTRTFAPSRKLSIADEKVHAEGWQLDINTKELHWESYVKAGYYGVLNRHFSPNKPDQPVPVNLLVTGIVPAGSGLSSSAAMVVASTLAFLAVNGKLENQPMSKGDLVRMAMQNEKRVGVNSGGMDQAASVMSDASSALYITFYPSLRAAPVRLPTHCVFVCANSLVVSDKAVTAKRRYNLRVVETLVGARVLAKRLGVKVEDREKITLREVVGRLVGEKAGEELPVEELAKALERMDSEVDVLRPKRDKGSLGGEGGEEAELGVTMEEMIEMTGLPKGDFDDVYLSWVEVEATYFQLYKRAKHVFSEALRVLKFRQLCLNAEASAASSGDNSVVNSVVEGLGQLMNESQESCSKLFECSCPELDELTHLARQAGAIGSRLTGAGWGGCTVSLVAESQVESFIAKIRDSYAPYKGLEGDALSEVIFATKPSSGACVYKFD